MSKFRCRPVAWASLFLLLWIAPCIALSQNCGEVTLATARDNFNNGNLAEAAAVLHPCLDRFTVVSQKEEGLQMMILIHLAQDQIDSARFYINRLLNSNPIYNPTQSGMPVYFAELLEEERRTRGQNQISSVSKREEEVRKAPATAMLLNRRTAEARGYTNLIEVLQDQPGFDLTISSADVSYASFYQRGYRSFNNDRTMFLIDGMEFSYLWSNNIFFSRQYPMSAFKQLEIIHGPASTMYGTNAYSGVINFSTLTPSDIIQPGKSLGAVGMFSLGSFGTSLGDVSLAGRKNDLSFVISARYFQSREWDRSAYADWDYKPSTVSYYTDTIQYSTTPSEVMNDSLLQAGHPFFVLNSDSTQIHLTTAGAAFARSLDSTAYQMQVNGEPVQYSEESKDLFLHGRFNFRFFTIGFDYYSLKEGSIGGYTDNVVLSSRNGTAFGPEHIMAFSRFQRPISEGMELMNLTTWHLSELNDHSREVRLNSYANSGLNYDDLVNGVSPEVVSTYYYQLSTQVRNETRLFWSLGHKKRWNMLSGVEGRFTFAQGDYLTSSTPFPIDSGSTASVPGGNYYRQFDAGIYTQGDFAASKKLKLVFGSRFDYHKLRAVLDPRLDFTPRLCAVYSPGKWIFKLILSKAFKAPSTFEKYSTAPGVRDVANPSLKPESAYNAELSAGYDFSKFLRSRRSKLVVDGNFFFCIYDNVIQTQYVDLDDRDGDDTLMNINAGQYYITGFQATAEWAPFKLGSLSFNYTYTNGWGHPVDEYGNLLKEYDEATGDSVYVDWQRIADIAIHKFNLIAVADLPAGFSLCGRLNYSGARPAGPGTTVAGSSLPNGQIDPTLLLNAVLSWKVPGEWMNLQIVCNNVFNHFYYAPGIRNATGIYASRIPQPGRNFMINASFKF